MGRKRSNKKMIIDTISENVELFCEMCKKTEFGYCWEIEDNYYGLCYPCLEKLHILEMFEEIIEADYADI